MGKNKTPKVPEIYHGLVRSNELAKQTLVIDKNGQVFRFSDSSKVHILKDAIVHQWNGWDPAFEAQSADDKLEWHKKLFETDPPKGTDAVESSLMCWLKLCSMAKDRSDETAEATKNKEKKLANRIYEYIDNPEGRAKLRTPQAIACLKILQESVDPKTHQAPEATIKKAVDDRQGELRTRQEPWRIFQYYRPTLVKLGLMRDDVKPTTT